MEKILFQMMLNLKKRAKIASSLLFYICFFKFRKFFVKLIFVFLFLFVSISGSNPLSDISTESNITVVNRISPQDIYVMIIKEKFHLRLIAEVENYIIKMAPASKLSPEYVISKCLEYNTDIIFVLSQALLESHFGTKGKAIKTNSVWNVGTYDNGKILYKYDHPDESIDPYLKLVNEKYLINVIASGDTIYKDLLHLIQDKGYINYDKKRFASVRDYENRLRKLMIKMDMETSISFYQEIIQLSSYEILAYFAPKEDLELDYSQLQVMK